VHDKLVKVYRISAITLFVKNMEASCKFYSAIPGFELVCGGISDSFTTYQIEGGSKMYLNLELREEDTSNDFGRFIQENSSGTIKKALHPQKWVELGM